jgi:predicted small lipoprotein YifL
MMLRSTRLTLTVFALAASLTLSGCGKKGPLEAPNPAVPTAADSKQSESGTVLTPVPKQPPENKTQPEAPQKPFFLDFLL